MKRKYFLFRKEDLSLLSSSSSDTGQGLSVFGVSADLMSYVTAIKGGVTLYFNNATPYEESNLTNGESFEKTSVTVNCDEGKEVDLVESIMNFLSSDSSPSVLKFDAVTQASGIKEVRTSLNVEASLKTHPVNRITGDVSFQSDNSFTADTGNKVNDIDFLTPDNKPVLDFEFETGTYDSVSPFHLTALANSGTGGAVYDIDISDSIGVSDPDDEFVSKVEAGSDVGLSKTSASFFSTSSLELENTLTINGDYTLYIVFNVDEFVAVGPTYGSIDGETIGFSVSDYTAGSSAATSLPGLIGLRHQGKKGFPATQFTNTTDVGTVGYKWPNTNPDSPLYQQCYVFVIRRDSSNNIYVYNHEGESVAIIEPPDLDPSTYATLSDLGTLSGDTSGALVIDQIGGAGDMAKSTFAGNMARFGVISRDVGDSVSRNLAKQLNTLYKF